MKVAIVAFHFKPDQAIGAVRAENWANWLSEEHEVVVVTREVSAGTVDDDNPYRIVRPSSFATRWIDRLNARRKAIRAMYSSRGTIAAAPPTAAARRPSGIFSYRMPCLYDVWLWASYRALRKEKPDVVIATHSPYISLITAWLCAKRNPHIKLWLDFRDLWTSNYRTSGVSFFRAIERWVEQRALARANIVTTVSEGL